MSAAPGYRGAPDLSGPGTQTVDVDAALSDTVDLGTVVRAIRCNTTAGNMVFHAVGDAAGTYRTVALAVGEKFDLCYIDRVKTLGTTAVGLLGVV